MWLTQKPSLNSNEFTSTQVDIPELLLVLKLVLASASWEGLLYWRWSQTQTTICQGHTDPCIFLFPTS